MPKPGQLSLNDFMPTAPSDENYEITVVADNLVTVEPKFDPKSSKFYMEDLPASKRFHRQMSREEKLYNRDKAVYREMVCSLDFFYANYDCCWIIFSKRKKVQLLHQLKDLINI